MRIAITGAAGYVGSLLVRAHAARGDDVHALARDASAIERLPGVTPYRVDLVDPTDLPDAFFANAEVVYHCAAEIVREPLMHAVNVEAIANLLERARGRVGHWVQVSSLSVYGRPRGAVITEETPPRPETPYATSKLEGDAVVARKSAGAFSYTLVRPSGVIGPGMRNRSIHALIDAVVRRRFCFIGPPGAIANYVHERNITDALMLCATRPEARGRTYNVSQNCTIERVIAAIAAALGIARAPVRIPESFARVAARIGRVVPAFPLTPGRVDALTSRIEYPSTRIERELGFEHASSIEDALRTLVAAYRESRS